MTATRRRLLLPREHGAYAQLLLPLGTALASSRPTLAGVALALASCAAFVAHEPALVLLGHRGTRARRESSGLARRWLAASLLAALALASLAVARAPAALAWMGLPAVLALASAILAARKEERTLLGELVACVTLGSPAVPIAVACDLAPGRALALWAVFCAAFAVSTVEVRAIAHRDVAARWRLAAWVAASTIVAGLGLTLPALALTPLPVILVVAIGVALAPSARDLRRLGWALATSSLVTALALVAALRVA